MTEIKVGYFTPLNRYQERTPDHLPKTQMLAEYWILLPDGRYECANVQMQSSIPDADRMRQSLIGYAKRAGVESDPKIVVRLVRQVLLAGPWVEADPNSVALPGFEPHEIPGYPA